MCTRQQAATYTRLKHLKVDNVYAKAESTLNLHNCEHQQWQQETITKAITIATCVARACSIISVLAIVQHHFTPTFVYGLYVVYTITVHVGKAIHISISFCFIMCM